MAYVQAAVYDAVTRSTASSAVRQLAVNGAGRSPRAAVITAAYTTLVFYLPAQALAYERHTDCRRTPSR